jgi:hypothetical protein
MKITATIKLHIDISEAEAMGLEISDPEEYAIEEMLEYIHDRVKWGDLHEVIYIEGEGE